MEFKRHTLLFILFLLICHSVLGEDTVTYRFKNEAGQAVKNVEVRGYTCNDINCNTVNTNYWSYSGNTGNSNTVTLVFPTSLPPSQRYALYFFAQEYIYKKFPVYWYGNDNEGIKDKIFQKTDNPCKADVSYINAINKIGEWLPLTIQTDTSLDSSTSAAIQFNNIAPFYKPWLTDTSLNQYMKLQTLISVNIREAGASQSIFSDSVTKNLLTNANSQNSFTWSTTQGHPGNYTITLTSHITDPKCSSVIDDSRSSQVEIFPSLPDGTCYTNLYNFDYSPHNIIGLYSVTFSGEKIANYGEYRYDADYNQYYYSKPINSVAELKITDKTTQAIAGTYNFNIGKNIDYQTRKSFGFAWTPDKYGLFSADIAITTNDAICVNGVPPATQTIETLEVGHDYDHDGYYYPADCNDLNASIHPGATEVCNGVDDDCDGKKDMPTCNCINGKTQACSSIYYGICAVGTAICVSGKWAGCPEPKTEVCQDPQVLDEDCDNKPNCQDSECTNIFQQGMNVCSSACQSGFYDANLNPSDGCECQLTGGGLEICDGKDNNCDGQIDNLPEFPSCISIDPAFHNAGICENQRSVCDYANHQGLFCADISQPELCDTIDNNCDGQIDEGCDDDLDNYYDGQMTCQMAYINSKNARVTCSQKDCNDNNASISPGAKELCDKIDNNCNPSDDDAGCGCILGDRICLNEGVCSQKTIICNATGVVSCSYTGIQGYESKEISCDGLDNDCNGKKDAEDGIDCCSDGNVKNCLKRCPDGSDAQGIQNCLGFVWETECDAACAEIPAEVPAVANPNLRITSPENEKTYHSSTAELALPLMFTYDGAEQCQYRLGGKPYIGAAKGTTILAQLGENRLEVRCGDIITGSKFFVLQTSFSLAEAPVISDTMQEFKEEGIPEKDLEKADESTGYADTQVSYSYVGDDTIIKQTIIPDKAMRDGKLYMKIPKCITPYLKDIEFDFDEYEVIKDDPIIAWHFDELKDRIDLSYKINKKIPKDCLDQIKGMVIADLLEDKKTNPLNYFYAIGLLIIVIGFTIWHSVSETGIKKPQDANEKMLKSLKANLLERARSQNFQTKEQAEQFLKYVPEEDREFVMKNLGFK